MKCKRILSLLSALLLTLCSLAGCEEPEDVELTSDLQPQEAPDALAERRIPVKMICRDPENGDVVIGTCSFEEGVLTVRNQAPYDFCTYERVIALDALGNVTSYIEYGAEGVSDRWEAVYDKAGNRLEIVYYYNDGRVRRRYRSVYDRYGNETESIGYDGDGNVTSRYESAYDKNGNRTKRAAYEGDGSLLWREEVSYDEKGNETEYIRYDDYGVPTTHYADAYDAQGNLILSLVYDVYGQVTSRSTYEYNENGDRTVYVYYDGTNAYRSEWEYAPDGKLLLYTSYHADGTVSDQEIHTYGSDGSGRLTEEVCYYTEGELYDRCMRKYNQRGEQIWEEWYDEDGECVFSGGYDSDSEYDGDGHEISYVRYGRNGDVLLRYEIVEFATVTLTRAQAEYIWDGFRKYEGDFFLHPMNWAE